MSLEKFSKKRVLIVDELDAFKFSTKQALKSLGLKNVDTASNAQTVLSGFQNIHYDLVLCNYDLGKGKNGQELLEELRFRKLLKFTGLFFIVSAEVERGKVMGTLENEPDGYLVKPVTPKDLDDRLGKALEQNEALKLINEAIDDGDYKSALSYCDKRLAEKAPYALMTMRTKAWLLNKLRMYQDAVHFYESILSQSDYMWAQYGLARANMRLKKYDDARALLEQIIAKDPDHIDAMDLLAKIFEQQGDIPKAKQYLTQACDRSPNSLLRQEALAQLCIADQDPDGAAQAYANVLKLGDQSVYAKPTHYYDYAEFIAEEISAERAPSHRIDEATKALDKVKKRFKQPEISTQVKLVDACVKVILGDDELAERVLEEVATERLRIQDDFEVDTLQVLAKTYRAVGRNEDADKTLEDAADLVAANSEELDDIYDQLNKGISQEDKVKAASINRKGIKLYQEGDIDAAAQELRMAVPLTPRHISLNLNLVQVLLRLARSQGANSELCAEVERYLHKVRHIPLHHHEYPRYQYLKERFNKLASD